jgi:hypothetical protein
VDAIADTATEWGTMDEVSQECGFPGVLSTAGTIDVGREVAVTTAWRGAP